MNILANKVSHLWTNENVLSLIEYTNDQNENNTLLLKASEILCALAKSSNIYFLFLFSVSVNQTDTENKLFENLVQSMIFHDCKEIALNFCLLSTSLLVLHSNKKNAFLDKLFTLTKSGLFSIILESDKSIENLHQNDSKLNGFVKNLKVGKLNY